MDNDVEVAIENLLKSGELQSKHIEHLNDNMVVLVQAVRMRPTRLQTLGIAGVLNLVTLVLLGFMMFFVLHTARDTKSVVSIAAGCLTPGERCYEQSLQNQQANRLISALRSELLRNQTELQLAQQRQDDTAIAFRQAKVNEYTQLLRDDGQDPNLTLKAK